MPLERLKEAVVPEILKRRDVVNFVNLRNSLPGEDPVIGDLLVRTFRDTYAKKLPSVLTTDEREKELRDVCGRRVHGCVRVLELGYQIIGTYALIPPCSALDESWTPNTATLRCVAVEAKFHALRLSDALVRDAIELARSWQVNAICLHVQQGALGVARLYQRHGFLRAPEGDRMNAGNSIEGYLLHSLT